MDPHRRGNRESQFHSKAEDWDPDTTLPQYHQNGITLRHWMVFFAIIRINRLVYLGE